MVRLLVALDVARPREESQRSRLLAIVVAALCALGVADCKKNQDPYASRPRRPMTAADVDSGEPPPTTAEGPEVERARVTMTALRAVVGFWRLEQGNRTRCPTLRDLAAAPSSGFDPNTMTRDPWGSSFEVDCLGGVVRLRSLGPDKQPETADDVIRY